MDHQKINQNYQALFTDIDGTLLRGSILPHSNIEAIQKALSYGRFVTLASGRADFMIRPLVKKLGLNKSPSSFTIALNGSYIVDNLKGRVLWEDFLSEDMTELILDTAIHHNVSFHAYHGNTMYFLNRENPRYHKFSAYTKDIHFIEKEYPKKLQKIIFIESSRTLLKTCEEAVRKDSYGIELEYSSPSSLEFVPCSAGKGKGLSMISQILQVPINQCLAIGDGENDLSMLLSAGLSLAPANALPSVKEKADIVLPQSCEDGAVAAAVQTYLLP